ncbi:MAG: hypothetical protein F9B45_32465 [Phycisphaera sp. RhM]|nr:hypothetical protein [Phycisphaera sp. RhM]
MGLVAQNLGPSDQTAITTLGPEIIRTLRTISGTIRAGNAASQTWFGDNGAAWIQELKRKLNRMASVINLQSIAVHGSELNRRGGGTYAAAQRPAGGWGDYTSVSASQGQNFHMRLDNNWNNSPLYATATNADSKFQTLVHELTHLILDTEDEEYDGEDAYGVAACQGLAADDPATAKTNADNWGYFVESFR